MIEPLHDGCNIISKQLKELCGEGNHLSLGRKPFTERDESDCCMISFTSPLVLNSTDNVGIDMRGEYVKVWMMRWIRRR